MTLTETPPPVVALEVRSRRQWGAGRGLWGAHGRPVGDPGGRRGDPDDLILRWTCDGRIDGASCNSDSVVFVMGAFSPWAPFKLWGVSSATV